MRNEDTILAWLREASGHAQAIEEVLMADYEVTRGQLDALWSYVGHKAVWEDAVYTLVRPLKALRLEAPEEENVRRWLPRTPAMAAGVTDHMWTVKELLNKVPLPSINS